MSANGRFTMTVEGLDHPEAVAMDGDGVLYAGGEAGQVYRVDLDAAKVTQVACTDGFLLGLCTDGAGVLYACDLARSEVLRVDPTEGVVSVYSNGTEDLPMTTPNWPVFDDAGNLYVTDSGDFGDDNGRIYRVTTDGRTSLWTSASSNFPNGACLSADGTTLLVVESLTPALVAIPILPDGTAGLREVLAMLPGVPDGVALDEDGTAYVACYRPDRVLRVLPSGDVEVFDDDPLGTTLAAPTNAAFVGSDRRTLVVANLGRWHLSTCEVERPGLPLRYPTVA